MKQAMRPVVTSIILTYNDGELLEHAAESVLNQSEVTDLLVINNATDDQSIEKLSKGALSSAKVVNTGRNLGPAGGRNLGIKKARSEWLAFLDGDDYWLPQRVEKMLAAVEADQSVDVVFADALIEQDGTLTKTRQSLLMPVPGNTNNMLEHLFKRNCINMCAVLMRTELAKKVLFDEQLQSAEDYDFWLRVAATGAKFKYIDEPLVVYRRYGKSLSSNRLHSVASTLKMLQKNEHLAVTATAQANLKEQRSALYEEQLCYTNDRAMTINSLSELKKLRPLGKKELSILYFTKLFGILGVALKRRLIKKEVV